MKNSISNKLIFGFSLCVVLLIAIVGFNYAALQKLDKNYHDALKRSVAVELATDAQHIGQDLYLVIANAVINRNMVKTEKDWAEAKRENLVKLQLIADAATKPQEQARIKHALLSFNEIIRIFEQEMLPLIYRGAVVPGPLADIDARIDTHIEEIDVTLQWVAKSISGENQRASTEFHDIISDTISFGLAVSLAGIAVALSVSTLTIRRIVGPLADLTRSAREIEKGKYYVELKPQLDDEPGVLAQAMKSMMEQVEKRTVELQTTNEQLRHEVGTRKLAEEKLQHVMNRLSILEEQERKNLSEVLHDTLGHDLALAKFKLSLLRQIASSPDALKEIDELRGLIEQSIQNTRTLTFELSSPVFYKLGLTAAIEWLCEHFQERYGMEINFSPDENLMQLSSEASILLFKSIRELLVNIVKHANASQVWITAETKDGNLIVDVDDDGIGFDVLNYQQNRSNADCFGLFSVRERMRYLGGTFEINSQPGRGTSAVLKVPLTDKGIL